MAFENPALSCNKVPQSNGMIARTAGEGATVRAEGDAGYIIRMSIEDAAGTAFNVPQRKR